MTQLTTLLLAHYFMACAPMPVASDPSDPAWLLRSDPVEPGEACPAGGVVIHQGLDDGAGNGVPLDFVLQDGEILQSDWVCAGSDGAAAEPAYGSLISVTEEAPGPWCSFGGQRIETGVDDGAGGGEAGDGELQTGERRSLDFVCASQMQQVTDVASTQRPSNTTCQALESLASSGTELETAFGGQRFQTPIWLTQPPGDADHWLVVEQGGKIWAFDTDDPAGSMELVLDLSDRIELGYEPGLLSAIFHPDWPDTRELFTYSVSPSEAVDHPNAVDTSLPIVTVLSRFEIPLGGGFAADPSRETLLLVSPQESGEHNGGWMGFDDAGMLMLSIGDGGGWPPEEAQDLSTLNGKVLRIDVDRIDSAAGTYYAIPEDNPFAEGGEDAEVLPEIVAWGFRNPWRGSLDPETGELWLGDVGLVTFEEINRVEVGGDHGWGGIEGDRCRIGGTAWTIGPDDAECDTSGTVLPEHGYRHALGCSITAGGMIRGSGLESLDDRVLYGDFCQGTVRSFDPETGEDHWIMDSGRYISTFAQGLDGGVYLADWWTGEILRFMPVPPQRPPSLLSETGCVDPLDPTSPAEGAIPFQPNAPFYTEPGIYKERYLFLPDGEQIFVSRDTHEWSLPIGSVTLKTFQSGDRMVETRLLMRNADGDWSGFSYRWNEAGTDAELLSTSVHETVPGPRAEDPSIAWVYPDTGGCQHCHTAPTNASLGPETAQLNGYGWFPDQGVWAKQLDTLLAMGVLRNLDEADLDSAPALPSPSDPEAELDARARAWLHVNCAGCHQPGGGGYGTADYRWQTPLSEIGVCDQDSIVTDFDLPAGAKVIKPGDPEASVLIERLSRSDLYRMHPYRSTVDQEGVDLLTRWIASLESCD